MSVSVLFAIKDALNHSRKEAGLSGWWKLGKLFLQKMFINLI